MPMDLIHGMQAFVTLANAGSFTETGRRLNLTTAQVSRTIAALESHLGVRPLNRTTRFMGLTEAGERYLSRTRDIMVAIDVSEREAHGARSHPHGRWRVHCSTSIANHFVIPLIVRFQTRHPDDSVDLTLAPHLPNIVRGSFDVAVSLAIAVRKGAGIGLLPGFVAADDLRSGALVRVLPNFRSEDIRLFLLYASRQYLDAKTRAWVDFVTTELRDVLARSHSCFATGCEKQCDVLAPVSVGQIVTSRDWQTEPDEFPNGAGISDGSEP